MSEQPSSEYPARETSAPAPGTWAGTPRWVKVFAVIGVVLAVLIVVMLLTGHGPGRHMRHGLRLPAPAAAVGVPR